MKIAVIKTDDRGRLEGTYYDIEHKEPESDRPSDIRDKLPLVTTHNGFEVYDLPNKRSFMQVDGTPIEAYVPRNVMSGDVPILSYERIRYQTLRDGMLIEPNDIRDGVIEILDPTIGIPEDYSLPYISDLNFVNENGPCLYTARGRDVYPQMLYEGATGHTPRPFVAWARDNNSAYVKQPGRYFNGSADTSANLVQYGHSEVSRVAEYVQDGRDRGDNYTKGYWKFAPTTSWTGDDAQRIINVVKSIGGLNYALRHMADPRWLTNCVTSQRGTRRRIYIRGDIKGVYVKALS